MKYISLNWTLALKIFNWKEKENARVPNTYGTRLYVSELLEKDVFIEKPVSAIFIPGRKLRNIFCASRPLDRPSCSSATCNIYSV